MHQHRQGKLRRYDRDIRPSVTVLNRLLNAREFVPARLLPFRPFPLRRHCVRQHMLHYPAMYAYAIGNRRIAPVSNSPPLTGCQSRVASVRFHRVGPFRLAKSSESNCDAGALPASVCEVRSQGPPWVGDASGSSRPGRAGQTCAACLQALAVRGIRIGRRRARRRLRDAQMRQFPTQQLRPLQISRRESARQVTSLEARSAACLFTSAANSVRGKG